MIHRIPYALVQWTLSGAVKAVLWAIGLPAVALGLVGDGQLRTPKMWRFWGEVRHIPNWWYVAHKPSRFWKWWWMAIRNPVEGMVLKHPDSFQQVGGIDETLPGFQWRYRWSSLYDSFRVVWGPPRERGKREFYIGWKLGSKSPFKFTVQLRPF